MNNWKYAIASMAVLGLVSACDTSRAVDADRDAAAGTVRVADIQDHPDTYVGQSVTVVADVEEVHSPRAFSLDEDSPAAGGVDNDLMVLSPQAGSLRDIDDQWLNNKVRVTGTVAKVNIVEVEREIGWDLTPELEARVGRAKAVIIAKSVERVE